MRRHRGSPILAALAAAAVLAGCGGTTSASEPSPAPGAPTVDPLWCDGLRAIDRQAADPAGATRPASDAIAAMRPVAIPGTESSLDVLAAAFGPSGAAEPVLIGPSAADRIDARLAAATLHAAADGGCGWPTIAVEAWDYGFGGLPPELPAGSTALRLTNSAPSEPHEVVLLRKHDPATDTGTLLALGPEMLTEADLVGGVMIEAGGTSSVVLDLTPGEYVAVCFIPVSGDPSGAPHAAHGMVADVTVVEGGRAPGTPS